MNRPDLTDDTPHSIELTLGDYARIYDALAWHIASGSYPEGEWPRDQVERIMDDIEDSISVPPTVIGLSGLPGAGKSHAAELLGDVYDAPVVSMGEAIREKYIKTDEYRGLEMTSERLGEFAAETRDEDPKTIPRWTLDLVPDDCDLLIVDGVRSVTDYEVLADEADEFIHVTVEAEFYTRLERLQWRAREGEEDFTAVDLAIRDTRELDELGYRSLVESSRPGYAIVNNSSEEYLNKSLGELVGEVLTYEYDSMEPLLPRVA